MIANRCVIKDNSIITVGGWGAGIGAKGGVISLTNCVLTGNNSAGNGGAIFLWDAVTFTLINCTVADNSAVSNGGGIVHTGSGTTIINMTNNIVANNTASSGNDMNIALATYSTNNNNLVEDCVGSCPGSWAYTTDPNLGTLVACGYKFHYPIQTPSDALGNGTVTGAPSDDICGNTRTVPFDIGATETSGMTLGNALDFDGVNDYVNITGYKGIAGTNARTVEAWIKVPLTATNEALVSWGTNSASQRWTLRIQVDNGTDGALRVEVGSGYITASTDLRDNTWHHIVATFSDDGTPNVQDVQFYVDGVLEGTSASLSRALNTGTSSDVTIGNDVINRYFEGQIDEVRIWSDVRTQAEIQANMYNYLTGSEANLDAYYRFDQGDASVDNTALVNEVIDYSGNCNKGSMTNMARTGATSNWIHPGNTEAPIPTTAIATLIAGTSATLNGEIFSIGETDVTTRGFCYAITDCPTTSNNIINETGTYAAGTYSLAATSLLPNTLYYYRSYSTNAQGTSYGETQQFTTVSFIPLGNALNFDGVDDYVIVPNTPGVNEFSTGNKFTIEFWCKINSDVATQSFVNLGGGSGDEQYSFDHFGGSFRFYTQTTTGYEILTTAPITSAEGWVHIAGYYDGVNSEMKLYKNGMEVASTNTAGSSLLNKSNPFAIGAQAPPSVSSYLTGVIDEVRIWNDVRTPTEIQDNMYSYIDPTVPADLAGLVAYYRFDQGNAGADNTGLVNEVIDYSANCNKGTLTNFALTGATSNWVHPGNTEAPIPTTFVPVATDYDGAIFSGFVFSEGESSITTRGFEYATDACYTANVGTVSETGTYTTGLYLLSPTWLAQNTTYFYRAYTTNAQGTSYGETQSFTTTAFTPLGNALDFDGTDDYVDIGAVLGAGSSYTKEAWIKLENNLDFPNIISSANSPMWVISNQINAGNNSGTPDVVSSNTLPNGTWVHVSLTYDAITNDMYLYENGIQAGMNLNATAHSGGNIDIGSWITDRATTSFLGQIDEVRIWNSARSQTEIQTDMYNYLAGNETGLIAYYRFDEGEVATDNTLATGNNITELVDYAGCNTGTLTNMALNGATSNWIHPGNLEAPIPSTTATSFISYASAGFTGEIFSIGETDVTTRGFQYATDACFTTAVGTVEEAGTYAAGIYGLTGTSMLSGTLYYFRAYTTNAQGTTYAETRTCTTTSNLPPGTCLDFTAASIEYVTVPDHADFNPASGQITYECWVKSKAATWTQSSFISQRGTAAGVRGIMINSGSKLVEFYLSQPVNKLDYTPTADITEWHHYAATYDGTTQKMYFDGILVAEQLNSEGILDFSETLYIGRDNCCGSRYSNVYIEELRVWNIARTNEEIIHYMNQTIENPAGEVNLVAYYRFDENGGTTLNDIKNGHDGTLFNTPVWTNSDAFNVWMGSTSTTWATTANWSDGVDGLPAVTANIHLGTANTPVMGANTVVNSAVVESGDSFTIPATFSLTTSGNFFDMGTLNLSASAGADPAMLTVNGELHVGTGAILNLQTPNNDDPSGSLITNGVVSGTGIVNIDRFFTVNNTWQHLGVPMANQSSALFTENTVTGNYNANLYSYNAASDSGIDPTDSEYANWDSYTDLWNTTQPGGVGVGTTLAPGTGYITYNEGDITANFSSIVTDLNTGDEVVSVNYTNNDNGSTFGAFYDGWNFISNPYASALDWSALTKSTSMDATVYFWNGTAGNYVYLNGVPKWQLNQAGTDNTGGGGTTSVNYQNIPAMQGFWIHLTSLVDVTENFTISNSARVHSAQALHRNAVASNHEYVKLEVSHNGNTDEMLVGYFADARTTFDSDYDAFKRLAGTDVPQIYSLTDDKQFPLAMNALPISSAGTRVKLGLQSTQSGTFSISLKDYNLTNGTVTLVDLQAGTTTDIQTNDYTFEFEAGDNRERFELFITTETVSIKSVKTKIGQITIYPNPSNGIFTVEATDNFALSITNISGKLVKQTKVEIGQTKVDLSSQPAGIYFVKLANSKTVQTAKIIIE